MYTFFTFATEYDRSLRNTQSWQLHVAGESSHRLVIAPLGLGSGDMFQAIIVLFGSGLVGRR
jgi:hypothetical protein